MRAPAIAGGHDERLRAIVDGLAGPVLVDRGHRDDRRLPIVEHQRADQRPVVEHDFLRLCQLAEREVGRIPGARRTDFAARVVDAAAAAAVERRQVARHRERLELQPALLRPGLQQLQVVGQRDRTLRIGLRPRVFQVRAWLAAHVEPALGLAVVALELAPLENRLHAPPQWSASPPTAMVIAMMPAAC